MPIRSLRPPYREVTDRARRAQHLLLLLDYDGTLAPFADQPAEARMPDSARRALERLSNDPRVTAAVISGRSLAELRTLVGLEGLVYSGNFGIEIQGRGLSYLDPFAFFMEPSLREAARDTAILLKDIPGVEVEFKRFTAAVHTRLATPEGAKRAERIIRALLLTHPQLECRAGRQCLNILPTCGWNKGKAAAWIRRKLSLEHALPLCAGDDEHDEDIFNTLPGVLGIKVGPPPTRAEFTVESPRDIWGILESLAAELAAADPLSAPPPPQALKRAI